MHQKLDGIILQPVINAPKFDLATTFGNFWSVEFYYTLKNKGLCPDAILLDTAKATLANFRPAVLARPNALIAGVGHGNKELYTGQNLTVLLNVNKPGDLEMMQGRYGSFLSCQFGQSIPTWLDAGMLTMMGYREDFVFCFVNASNQADPIAHKFAESHFAYDYKLIEELAKGTDPYTADALAYEAGQKRFLKNYQEANNASSRQLLMYDSVVQVHGARGSAPPPPPPPSGQCGTHTVVKVDGEVIFEKTDTEEHNVEVSQIPVVLEK